MSQEISLEMSTPLQPGKTVLAAFLAILAGHVAVDFLSALVPTTVGMLEARLGLTSKQTAWLLGMGPLCSGAAQPLCALVSDRLSTRQLGVVGLALSALGIGALGFADGFVSLAVVYILGVVGIGMFHPVGAATIGSLWQQRRTAAVSCFFVAGMLGGVVGSLAWPRIMSVAERFDTLPILVAPVLLLAVVLQRSFAGLEPLHARRTKATQSQLPPVEWGLVGLLYVAAALRFCVNTALTYLFLRWAQSSVAELHSGWSLEQIATEAAPEVGNLNAALLVGMATGGLLSGVLVRPGKEKWPMVLVPLGFAPIVALFPFLSIEAGYFLAVAAGIGFAAMIPVTIVLAQHLMPGRTNLASSLMMGGAWAVAMLGPTLAEWGVSQFGLQTTFIATAVALALAGLVCLPVRE